MLLARLPAPAFGRRRPLSLATKVGLPMSLFGELKRRNVFRAALAYIFFAWLLLQIVDFALDAIGAPNWILQTLLVLAIAGLPAVVVTAWVYELTPEGLKKDAEVDHEQSIRPQTATRRSSTRTPSGSTCATSGRK